VDPLLLSTAFFCLSPSHLEVFPSSHIVFVPLLVYVFPRCFLFMASRYIFSAWFCVLDSFAFFFSFVVCLLFSLPVGAWLSRRSMSVCLLDFLFCLPFSFSLPCLDLFGVCTNGYCGFVGNLKSEWLFLGPPTPLLLRSRSGVAFAFCFLGGERDG